MNSVFIGIVHLSGVLGWLGAVVLCSLRFLKSEKPPGTSKDFGRNTSKKCSACLIIAGPWVSLSGQFYHYQHITLQVGYRERFWWIHTMILVWSLLAVVLFLLDPYFQRMQKNE